MNSKKIKLNSGFTLIESMIAITLIIVTISGLLILVNRSLGYANLAFNRLTAANLGQEGIELVRNIRDTNWLNQKNWLTGLDDGTYQIDHTNNALMPYTDQPLLLEETLGYNYTAGDATIYYRKIEISKISNNEIRVKCTVTWSAKGGKNFDTVVEQHLLNWL